MTIALLDEVFLPYLSLLTSDCRNFSQEQKRWTADTTTTNLILLRSKAAVPKSIKKLMQGVSKKNVKPTGHILSGLLFTNIRSRSKVNLNGAVIDSLKYLSDLSFDVLGFCIIESLNNPGRARIKIDDTSFSEWLTALSSFCEAVYKKHTNEIAGPLQ